MGIIFQENYPKKILGKTPQTRHELKERVDKYLLQETGTTDKQTYLKAISGAKSQHVDQCGSYHVGVAVIIASSLSNRLDLRGSTNHTEEATEDHNGHTTM